MKIIPAGKRGKLILIVILLSLVLLVTTVMRTEQFRIMWQVSPPRRNSSHDQRGEVMHIKQHDVSAFQVASNNDNYTNQRVIE